MKCVFCKNTLQGKKNNNCIEYSCTCGHRWGTLTREYVNKYMNDTKNKKQNQEKALSMEQKNVR